MDENNNKRNIKDLKNLPKKERKIIRIRNVILRAAKELFSERNYNRITMEEIADLAALSRATLYNYFKTKEEIYFTLGILKLKKWIKLQKTIDSSKYSGKKKLLMLTENLVKDLLNSPVYLKLLKRFFERSKELKLPIENIFYSRLIEGKHSEYKPNIKPQNKIILDLLDVYIEYRQIWQKYIELGLKDGSIKSSSNIHHLNFFIIMFIFGLLDQIEMRQSLMKMVDITHDKILKFILQLTRKILNGEI